MNMEEMIYHQYKLYTEQKEKFIDRSFQTNKFYLLLILIIIFAMFSTKDYSFVYGISSIFLFSGAGMAVCFLWWINVDSYNFLIKVKFTNVIEELEKKLPVKPYTDEFVAIKDIRKKRREFLFADIQKALATITSLVFLVLFINEVIAIIFG